MDEWDLVKAICKAVNQDELSDLINDCDFEGKEKAQSAAVSRFLVTKANVQLNSSAAKKVANFRSNGVSAEFRLFLLNDIIDKNMIAAEQELTTEQS